jgi:hypothetical protein
MSTSPSWFDQEKLSRLVKKVGPKKLSDPPAATVAPAKSQPLPPATSAKSQPLPPAPSPSASQPLPPAPSASQRLPDPPENGPATIEEEPPLESLASTARISLVSKPPSLLAEHRALPALPRRTTPLPGLKALFGSSPTADKPGPEVPVAPIAEMPAVITQPLPEVPVAPQEAPKPVAEPAAEGAKAADPAKPLDPLSLPAEDDDLAGIWQKMALLNEELAQTIQERDHAHSDINLLREQLRQADEKNAKSASLATPDEFAQVARERDAAVAELELLKQKAAVSDSQKIQLPGGISKTKELVFLAQERDQARKEYAELRKQFEMLKRDQTGSLPTMREDSGKFRKEMEQQLEGFRVKLEEKNREIAALKAKPPSGTLPAIGAGSGDSKAEIDSLKAALAKAKEDASIAQRGLALSQKALQETRDTLREATEGTSMSRHNFDNLKAECASLMQQITVLQAQNEQLSRELAAAKQRQSGRLPS